MKILLAGDFCPAGKIERLVLEGNSSQINTVFDKIRPYSNKSDFVVVNLECPLTHEIIPISKVGPNLKADPKTIVLLENLGVDLVAMANNHIYDYGQGGLEETLNVCHKHKIATVGAGKTLVEAQQAYIAIIKGKRVAFVNFAENEFCNANKSHGGANPMDIIDNLKQINSAKQQADIVIVIIHGGHELFHYPSPRMIKQYRFYAELGITAIIGHHPHCICGYEIHQGVPIFYSLGNFLFDRETSFEGWYEGYMVELNVGDTGECGFSIIPYEQCRKEVKVHPLNNEELACFQERLEQLSDCIQNEYQLQTVWEEFVERKYKSYLFNACMRNRRFLGLANKMNLLRFFVRQHRVDKLLNLIRCEAHRDVLIKSLKKGL